MKILLTGASSFTGYWFGRKLAEAGHEVVCVYTADLDSYQGIRAIRVGELSKLTRSQTRVKFGDERFLATLEAEAFDVLCCHGAYMEGYRNNDFDFARAVAQDTLNLKAVIEKFSSAGGKAIVYTGSVFEPHEGAGSDDLRGFSAYGATKSAVFEFFKIYAQTANLPLGKFVIPNPFGSHEEPKLPSYLVKAWSKGEVPTVRTPDYIRDNIAADLLADCYAAYLTKFVSGEAKAKVSPSHFVESQGAFVQRFAAELGPRLGWKCEAEFAVQAQFPEPRIRINTDPALELVSSWDSAKSWDNTAAFYQSHLDLY